MKKSHAKRIKAPRSERFGSFVARHSAGAAKRLGRLAAKTGKNAKTAAGQFKEGFVKEMSET